MLNKFFAIIFLITFIILPYFVVPECPSLWNANNMHISTNKRAYFCTPVSVKEPKEYEGTRCIYQAKCDRFFLDMRRYACATEKLATDYLQRNAEKMTEDNLSNFFYLEDIKQLKKKELSVNGIDMYMRSFSAKKNGTSYEVEIVNMCMVDEVWMFTFIYLPDDYKAKEHVKAVVDSIQIKEEHD